MTTTVRPPRRTRAALAALLGGTLLAPLNSSMVAVALTPIQRDLGEPLATTTWVVTVFYLTACVCQPVLGRVADRVGPRRLFAAGMALAALASAASAAATSLPLLVLCRCAQAVGVSAAFPCAMVVIRRDGDASRLSAVATVNTTAGAVGPVLGGLLTSWAGWQAVFWVNLPVMLGALVLAWRAIGPDERRPERGGLARAVDPVGVVLFAATVVGLLVLMLALPAVSVPGAVAVVVAGTGFLWWERRAAEPFVDVRALAAAGGPVPVLGAFVLFNLAYYGAFYGLPPWLQTALGFDAAQAGLLIMPIAATSVVATVLGGPVMRRFGARPALLAGGGLLLAGVALITTFGAATPAWAVVLDGVVLGVPYGLCNLGLQRLMYERAPAGMTGVVGGLFQSARYVGAILAVGLVGAFSPADPSEPADPRGLAVAMTAVAAVVIVILARDLRRPGRYDQ
ncbi:MFS transporter [Microbispora rosea subsp. aerata]|nr:MFS transporter [Microbispora rosea]GGO22557.1 MFS transporter [Microbispora rosea subsp. aerata]GIH57420.1 MFS transporter [Microbispora rosea subsp. aerata]GLJ86371.1 MFS transporter [Microbispora rosea subsp. aerata]